MFRFLTAYALYTDRWRQLLKCKQQLYMLGSGFLRQMNETIKYNRDLLRKKKPFEKSELRRTGKTTLIDNKPFGDKESKKLINDLKIEHERERRKKLLVLFMSIGVTLVLILIFKETLLKRIIDFIR